MKGENAFVPSLALFSAAVFWGISFIATKIALESIPVFTLVFVRLALGTILFSALFLSIGFPRFSRQEHLSLFLIAFFEPGLYFVFETIGLQYTTAAKASLIVATIPIVVLVLAYFFLGERSTPAGLVGILVSILGTVVLIAGDARSRPAPAGRPLGDLLIFGAVASAAIYTIRVRELGLKRTALEITGMQTMYGALLYAPAFLWEVPTMEWSLITGRSIGAIIYLTLFATVGAFFCYNYALSRVPASRASVFLNGVPVVTALAAWWMLGERLTPVQCAGGGLVLLGVFLTNHARTPVPKKKLR